MWKVPLFDISFDEKEVIAAQEVIRSGWLTMGEVTQEFEQRFAEFRVSNMPSPCRVAPLHSTWLIGLWRLAREMR
jgi:hypothetical protein